MKIKRVIRKEFEITVREMTVRELDKSKCSNKFLQYNFDPDYIVHVKCDENGNLELRGNKKEYRLIPIIEYKNKIMEPVSYSNTSMWKHKLTDDELETAQAVSNRSDYQTQFLYNLVGGNFNKLMELEQKIKSKFVSGCPDCVEELNEIMS